MASGSARACMVGVLAILIISFGLLGSRAVISADGGNSLCDRQLDSEVAFNPNPVSSGASFTMRLPSKIDHTQNLVFTPEANCDESFLVQKRPFAQLSISPSQGRLSLGVTTNSDFVGTRLPSDLTAGRYLVCLETGLICGALEVRS